MGTRVTQELLENGIVKSSIMFEYTTIFSKHSQKREHELVDNKMKKNPSQKRDHMDPQNMEITGTKASILNWHGVNITITGLETPHGTNEEYTYLQEAIRQYMKNH